MAITIIAEDGSGDPTANAYADVDYVDAYHAERGNAYWDLLDDDTKAACVVRATDYIDKRFGQAFRGFRMTKDQALLWPRLAAFDDDEYSLDGVPIKLQKAMAEYALRAAIYNVLAPDPLRTTPAQDMSSETSPNESTAGIVVGPVKSISTKVGPIEKSVSYEGAAALALANQRSSRTVQSNVLNDIYIPQYPEADMLIEPLLDNSEIATTLVRA